MVDVADTQTIAATDEDITMDTYVTRATIKDWIEIWHCSYDAHLSGELENTIQITHISHCLVPALSNNSKALYARLLTDLDSVKNKTVWNHKAFAGLETLLRRENGTSLTLDKTVVEIGTNYQMQLFMKGRV